MSELAYLFLAILLSVAGSAFLWVRHGRPQTLEGGVNQFSRGLEALETMKSGERRSV